MSPTVSTLLCPVDLSEYSAPVLAWAQRVAMRCHAFLVIVHAVLPPRERLCPPVRRPDALECIAAARARIQVLMNGHDLPWEACVTQGDPVHLAATLAERFDADLIIAGSHGLSGVKRLVLGSVVERMAREIPRPILVLRCQDSGAAASGQTLPVARVPDGSAVVVSCDLAPGSARVVEWGCFFSRLLKARLVLVHAMESPVRAEEEQSQDCYAALQEKLQEDLCRQLLASLPQDGSTRENRGTAGCDAVVLTGNPTEAILRFSRDVPAGLMVVGVRHRSVLGRLLTGSFTEMTLRSAPCHVLAVPEFPAGSGQAVRGGRSA